MDTKSTMAALPWWRRLFVSTKGAGDKGRQETPRPPVRATPPNPKALANIDDPFRDIRFGYRIIVLGIGGFLLWATTVPIDEGVSAQGTVTVESQRKTVSHLTGGTVVSSNVMENQQVKQGDALITLDSTRTKVAYDSLLTEYILAAAKLARLTAEQTFATSVQIPPDVQQFASQLGREDVIQAQIQLFKTRQRALENEQAILRENLSSSGIQIAGIRQQLDARRRQIELLSEEIKSNRPLAEEGYIPRNRLLEQERQLAEFNGIASDLQARIAREGSSGSEIRLRLLQRRQEYLKEVETTAAEARREVSSLTERLKDAKLELDRSVIRAPVTGQVVNLLAQGPGSIITPGVKLMEIVPAGDKLLLDAHIPVNVAHRVKPGTLTDIRITIFPESPSLIIEGKIASISSDRHESNNPTQQPYYLARVEVTQEGLAKLNGRSLRPGMSTDIVVKTGERSFLAYLMAPINRRLFEAFREQ